MLRTRVIPCLLMQDGGLVKTVKFRKPFYVGDPVNTVKIFNKKEVDELVLLDIGASSAGGGPDYEMIKDIVSEAFMPLAYGGGITTLDQAKCLFEIGIEKIVINSVLATNLDLVDALVNHFGSSSVVVAIDVRKTLFGRYDAMSNNGQMPLEKEPVELALELEKRGAGEIFLTAIDRDGMQTGYDCRLIKKVTKSVRIPLVASGGAAGIADFQAAVDAGASAVAAGSMFVYHGPHRAVLISYPTRKVLEGILP